MKFFAWPGGFFLGTFLMFFMIFLMGVCWWLGLSYDYIYRSVRECAELRKEIALSGKGTHPEIRELTEAYDAAADRANHRMCHTISGRLISRIFNFHTVRKLGE